MGLFDKLKGAMNAVTGGCAKVTIEYQPQVGLPGDYVRVRVTATSTGAAINSKGVYVDLLAQEAIHLKGGDHDGVHHNETTFNQEVQIAPAFQLAAGQALQWEGQFQLPPTAQPSYVGRHAKHEWFIRGRIEAFGNDPDSGWQPFRVGARP